MYEAGPGDLILLLSTLPKPSLYSFFFPAQFFEGMMEQGVQLSSSMWQYRTLN